MKKLILIFALCCPAFGQLWSGTIDPSRAVDWSSPGAAINVRSTQCITTACNTVSGGTVTSTSVLAAMSSASGSNTYVKVPAGTFHLASGLCEKGGTNFTLRGAGADQTFFILDDDCSTTGATGFVGMSFASTDNNWKNGTSNLTNLTGTFTKGQTTLTWATVPNLKVGFPVEIDQTDDSSDNGAILVSDATTTSTPPGADCTTNGGIAPCGTHGPFSLEGNGGGAQRSGRQQMQVVTITGCGGITTVGASCSGTNVSVTFTPGLTMSNWSSGRSPQAWWPNGPALNVGIEDFSVDVSNAGAVPGIAIANCDNCWVTGVRTINSNRSHIQIDYSDRVTVRSIYMFLTQNSASQSYGVECYAASDVLVENIISQGIVTPVMINGSCGRSVVGYNYSINNYYTASSRFSIASTNLHTAGIENVLYEGNVFRGQFYGDVFHGPANLVTLNRNRFDGPQPTCYVSGGSYSTAIFGACNNNLDPIVLESYHRFFNLTGNVFGTIGQNTAYQNGGSNVTVYSVGSGNSEPGHTTVPDDPNDLATLFRWGNWDSSTQTVRFVSGEVPSVLTGTQAAFSNPIPASSTVPSSYYLTGKPAFWPTAKAWPGIGPEITGGNISGTGGHANTNPAMDCALNVMLMPADGTGPVRSFNANTCYGSGAPPVQPPSSPATGLFAKLGGK